MEKTLILIVSVVFSIVFSQTKITNLPGYNGPELSQYTGYITLNVTTDKNYFYWLVESENDPSNDPLIVWYQGGPGCSGLFGLFVEFGPFRPNDQGGIDYNDVSWTKFANLLFLDQPTGVGFSYSESINDYFTNDLEAAQDNFVFLERFFEVFPQYVGRKTYLVGESYGGVYIPTLTSVILANPSSVIYNQLAGLALGNPVINCSSANYLDIQMGLFYYHGLISYSVWSNWTSYSCNLESSQDVCMDIFNNALNQIGVILQQKRNQQNEANLDPDNLYQDFCTGNGTLEFAANQGYPTDCSPVGDLLTTYLNRGDVQQVLNVAPLVWESCNSGSLHYDILGLSMIPFYQKIFQQIPHVDILVWSGDVDVFTVPFGYTQACLSELQDEIISEWQPWFVNEATAGYTEVHEHFTYATVKGAGHEAPQYQPLTAWNMMSRFLTDNKLTGKDEPKSNRFSQRMTQARLLRKYGVRV